MSLPRKFYAQETLCVAEKLLGKILIRRTAAGIVAGKIVETEAYIGETDPACHAARGKTRRNLIMYGAPGYAYVYFTYGMHYMLNVVTERKGFPAAVLIRALEPIEGIEVMKSNRCESNVYNLTSGPGKLCEAFGIDTSSNGLDLCGKELFLENGNQNAHEIIWSPRIGISVGKDKIWRCYVAGNPFVSRKQGLGATD